MSLRKRIYAPPVPKMPPGLVELMDGLARDVLKNKPDNIFEFCASHMHKLLEIRDGRAPKQFLTLEQKIARAQQKINQRAEQRRREYDEKLKFIDDESVNKQHVLPVSQVADESKAYEEKEIENKPTEIKEEENEVSINFVEQTDMEKTNNDTEEESDYKKGTLQISVDEEKEEKELSHEDTVKDIESDAINIKSKNEGDKTSSTINVSIYHLENNQCEENHTISLNHSETAVIDLGKEDEHKSGEDDTTTVLENIPNMDVINSENISTEQDSGLESQNEGNESGSEIKMKIELDDNIVKDAVDEIISTDNHITQNTASPPIDDTSENLIKTEHDEHTDQDTEIQIYVPPSNNSLTQLDAENVLIKEPKKDSLEDSTEVYNKPEMKQEDDKILAVILSTKSPEPDFVESNESDSQNIESNQDKEDNLDFGSNPDSSDDKTRNVNSSMDLETAAITIQKVFRSFLFKTKTASYDDSTSVDMNLLNEDKEKEESNALNITLKERRPLGISRMDTVLQTVNEEKSLSLSTDDSSTLSSAATIIQAHVRGFLVRNKYNLNKTTSNNSLIDSDAPSIPSLEADSDNRKSKTILNIHIVPEGGHFVSRDESILTSMDLSLDSSPPSSVNLHPLGYDKSERRKLKREDAIQSVSPPSNNSGKLSDEIDSVKDILTGENSTHDKSIVENENHINNSSDNKTNGKEKVTAKKGDSHIVNSSDAADEMDVITPFVPIEGRSSRESDNSSKLIHSGEFHDIVVPTNVTRSDTSVVREFQNVLVYFILWNN